MVLYAKAQGAGLAFQKMGSNKEKVNILSKETLELKGNICACLFVS